ncbi:hypothetical protein LZP69_06745 [Shewanella sp. AS1]|uniref:hypothetical protein n=1 Tax=Shewanella sp. AS1 TaxID=2907626 RepID=UPI001F324AFE|nr:hypothetical protein [Shewanella sp. AS1]MCE9678882.1 hypothetical protein [Shewanella sp. AS1]
MIKIEINGETTDFSNTNPSWITKNIVGRQKEGIPIYIRIFIELDNINVTLSCGDSPTGGSGGGGSGGGGRAPNEKEAEILSLWHEKQCSQKPINPGRIIEFLKHFS